MSNRTGKILGYILFTIGLLGLVGSFVFSILGERENEDLLNEYIGDESLNSSDEFFDVEVEKEEKDAELSQKDVVGIVEIDKIKVRYPIVKGTDPKTLNRAIGYFPETAMPGQVGNFAIAGHRNSSRAKFFNRLDEMEKGDEVVIKTKNATYTYVVDNIKKIHETEMDVLKQGDDKRITLITCTNGYKPKYRIVVQGKLKESA